MINELFSLDFDPSKFTANLDKAIQSIDKLETSTGETIEKIKKLGLESSKVSFNAPAGEILKLNDGLKQVNLSTLKLDTAQLKLGQTIKTTDSATRAYQKDTELLGRQLEVLARIEENTKKKIKETGDETQKTQSKFGKFKEFLKGGVGNILASLGITAGIAGLIGFGKAVLDITAEMEKYKAVLTNTLGSSALAENALGVIQKFASETPFSVAQLTESFVKLANQGFVPTVEQLRQLGDLASSTGKEFNQLAEAILDAQTGEFERLKEFGIKAKQTNDSVIFTFKGVTTEVNKSSEAIRDYITGLGDIKGVAGSMEAISKTLTGQLSNLGDAWDRLLTSIGNQTKGVVSTSIGFLSTLLNKLSEVNEGVVLLEKNNADSFGGIFSTGNRIRGEILLAFQKDARKFAEEGAKTVKTQEDFDNLLLDLAKKGNDKLTQLRQSSATNNVKLLGATKNIYEQEIIALKDQRKKQLEEEALKANAKKVLNQKTLDEQIKQRKALEKEMIATDERIAKQNFDTNAKSEEAIKAQYKREYELKAKEIDQVYKLLSNAERNALKAKNKTLLDLQTAEDIKTFKEAKAKALIEIEKEIKSNQLKIEAETLDALDDTYENQIAKIAIKEKQLNVENEIQRKQSIENIDKLVQEGLVEYEESLSQIDGINANYRNKQIAISAQIFKETKEATEKQRDLNIKNLEESNAESLKIIELANEEEIAELSKKFVAGEINQKTYEDNVNRIIKEAGIERLKLIIQQSDKEIEALNKQVEQEPDEKRRKSIFGKILDLSKTKADAEKGIADLSKVEGKAFNLQDSLILKALGIDPNDPEGGDAIRAVKQTYGIIVDVLNTVARNEQLALDRSIELQRRKVTSAQRIADAGNAEYLQQEEEKLAELERQREESSRKQIAINTALQASQLLVSITGAVMAISAGPAGPALVATNIATIIGALTTGYALIDSLNSNVPSFYDGIDYIPLGNNKKGKDTVPAMLHEGEAVIQADKNAKYAPTIKAIRRGLVDPSLLNSIAQGGLNYSGLGNAIEVNNNNNYNAKELREMNDKLERLTMIMSGTNKSIDDLNFNVNLDSDGFSASIQKAMNRKNKILNA
jgi:hypothetical protein